MSIFGTFDRYLTSYRRLRQRVRAERMISSLPAEVQKDIGWPDAYEESRWRMSHKSGRYS